MHHRFSRLTILRVRGISPPEQGLPTGYSQYVQKRALSSHGALLICRIQLCRYHGRSCLMVIAERRTNHGHWRLEACIELSAQFAPVHGSQRGFRGRRVHQRGILWSVPVRHSVGRKIERRFLLAGIKVDSSWTYKASFFYRFPTASSFSGTVTVGLRSSSGATLGSATATVRGSQTTWAQVNLSFRPTSSASDLANTFFVSVDGGAAAGQTINFAMFSLFPPTYKNRPNGMRVDIAEVSSRTRDDPASLR